MVVKAALGARGRVALPDGRQARHVRLFYVPPMHQNLELQPTERPARVNSALDSMNCVSKLQCSHACTCCRLLGRPLHHDATLPHYKQGMLGCCNVVQHIARHGDDVGPFARFQRTDLRIDAQ